jgi:hypothetical protein
MVGIGKSHLQRPLMEASQFQAVHVNKGLTAIRAEENEQPRQCAIDPKVADAFTLMIVVAGGSVDHAAWHDRVTSPHGARGQSCGRS